MKNGPAEIVPARLLQAAGLLLLTFLLSGASSGRALPLALFLLPTARCVSAVAGVQFHFIPAQGYAAPDQGFIIAPECSGLRFFIIAAALGLLLCGAARTPTGSLRAGVFVAAASYGATIAANTMRIVSILFVAQALDRTSLPPAVHEALGAAAYFFCLMCLAVLFGAIRNGQ